MSHLFNHCVVLSFHKCLTHTYDMPGPLLVIGDTATAERVKNICHHGEYIPVEEAEQARK